MKYFLIGLVFLMGCTDAEFANFTSLGSSAHITCYSGDKVTYDGISTGKVSTVTHSDGWQFKDSKTGKFMRVSGPCVIEN
jgi:hypothetical protein